MGDRRMVPTDGSFSSSDVFPSTTSMFYPRFPEQRLSRIQALKGMTLDAAYASFAEHQLGSLSPGKKADFVVLDRDIMTCKVEDILLTKVLATVVDGKVLYGEL
jgi:predicted amidohydrolase YtcJ